VGSFCSWRERAVAKHSEVIRNYAYHSGGLEITFNNGRIYRYDCPAAVYYFMRSAVSKGAYYNRRVKGKYDCHEVLLRHAVNIDARAYARRYGTAPIDLGIEVCGDVIIVGGHSYGDGAEATANYFLDRAMRWLKGE
jgi:hypothetical protein